MKHLSTNLRLSIILIILILITYDSYAKESITEGTSFWFAIPDIHKGLKELPRSSTTGAPEELLVSSKFNTTVRLYNSQSSLIKSATILANSLQILALPSGYQNTESEVITNNKSFYLESDEPISATVSVNWYKSGESFHLIPTEYLGTEYYTLNLYNDRCKMTDDGAIEGGATGGRMLDHPPQILIVATEDNTEVQYIPTANTEKVAEGNVGIVKLNRGQSFLILGDASNPLMNQYEETDLTGTRIISNKNIAVFSGHTKAAFPRFAAIYFSAYSADYLRNMLFETMLPVNLLGYEYVTVPTKYLGRIYQHKIPDDEGDLIRFIATEDNTDIYEMKSDGSNWIPIRKALKKGKYFDINSRIAPGYFKSNNKIIVGQYGKGWFRWDSTEAKLGVQVNKEDQLQAPSASGEGMLIEITPNNRWSNYASFSSINGEFNYFTIVCKTGNENDIFLDGVSIKQTYGGKIKAIPGTPFSYLSATCASGQHSFEATKDGVLFSVYAYGNIDARMDGFAYGYPTGVNFAEHCADSLYLLSTNPDSNIINGTINAIDLATDANCAKILNIKREINTGNNENALFTYTINPNKTTATFRIEFPNIARYGHVKFTAMTSSGSKIIKEFTYKPSTLTVSRSVLRYELNRIWTDFPNSIKISNIGLDSVSIDSLYIAEGKGSFRINSNNQTNIILAPGATKNFEILARFNSDDIYLDSAKLIANIHNRSIPIVDLYAEYNSVIDSSGDDNWGKIKLYIDEPTTKMLNIKNSGNTILKITAIKFKEKQDVFELVDTPELISTSPNNPYLLDSATSLGINVKYHPELSAYAESSNDVIIEFANNTSLTIPITGKFIKVPLFTADSSTMKFTELELSNEYTLERDITNISNIDVGLSSIKFRSSNPICNFKISGITDSSVVNTKSSKTVRISVMINGESDKDIINTLYISYLGTIQDLFKVLIPKSEIITSVEQLEKSSTLPKGVYLQNSKIVFENKDNKITNIELWNEAGKLLNSYEVNANNFELSAENLKVGVYLYQIQIGTQLLKGKFLIAPFK